MSDAKVGEFVPVVARAFTEDGEDSTPGWATVFYIESQSGTGLLYFQSNGLAAALASTPVQFPLTFISGKGHVLAGGWQMPALAKGLEVVCDKIPPVGVIHPILSERWSVTQTNEDDISLPLTIGVTHADIEFPIPPSQPRP